MALTQSESIVVLATAMVFADGEMSEQEIMTVIQNNSLYLKYFESVDMDLFNLKLKRGEATEDAAVSTLKAKSLDTQLDALAIVWHILIADGIMKEGEEHLMDELLFEFDIDIDIVTSRLEKIAG